MRRKILSQEHENWIFHNYSEMSNDDLVRELSALVRADYLNEVARLNKMLTKNLGSDTKSKILKRIDDLSSFDGVSLSLIKRTAKRLQCPKKPMTRISQNNRKKAVDQHMKRWKSMSIHIDAPFAWFRDLLPRHTYYASFKDLREMKSFKSSLCNWNRTEGRKKCVFLMAEYYKADLIARVEVHRNIYS